MNYNEAVKVYINYCTKQRKLSVHTIKSYRGVITQFWKFASDELGITEVEDIGKVQVRLYLEYLNANFSPSTSRHHFVVTGGFFSYMEEMELIEDSPFHKVHARIRTPKRLPKTMSLKDVNRILIAAYTEEPSPWNGGNGIENMVHHRNCLILEFLFNTGLRVQELCDLKIDDFDLETGVINVFGKGSKERKCYITEKAIFELYNKYMKYRKSFMKKLGKRSNYIFVTRFGAQMSTQSVRLMIDKYVKIAGIKKKITPHVFRHTFASLLLEEGLDLKHIQTYLGHSTIATTQIYLHVSDTNARKLLIDKHPRHSLEPQRFDL